VLWSVVHVLGSCLLSLLLLGLFSKRGGARASGRSCRLPWGGHAMSHRAKAYRNVTYFCRVLQGGTPPPPDLPSNRAPCCTARGWDVPDPRQNDKKVWPGWWRPHPGNCHIARITSRSMLSLGRRRRCTCVDGPELRPVAGYEGQPTPTQHTHKAPVTHLPGQSPQPGPRPFPANVQVRNAPIQQRCAGREPRSMPVGAQSSLMAHPTATLPISTTYPNRTKSGTSRLCRARQRQVCGALGAHPSSNKEDIHESASQRHDRSRPARQSCKQ
jgi:hypothetical protein